VEGFWATCSGTEITSIIATRALTWDQLIGVTTSRPTLVTARGMVLLLAQVPDPEPLRLPLPQVSLEPNAGDSPLILFQSLVFLIIYHYIYTQ
jgi:hypothetical protein